MRSEFEFIKDLKAKYDLKKVGDDCAVLPRDASTDLLITSDMLVEDIDFRLEWAPPELIGHKALAVSLSDIAAMGGTPEFAMLSIAVSEKLWKTDFVDRLYAGWHRLASEFGVELVGGDISRSPDKLVLDSTVLGSVPKGKGILRSRAKAGDAIFVSGMVGGAAAGLKILEKGEHEPADLITKHLAPTPQVKLGKRLQELSLTSAMIDISDGLAGDLAHICEASGVGANIRAEGIPRHPELIRNFPPDAAFEIALNGGEDFELLFTADPEKVAEANIAGVARIGEVTGRAGELTLEIGGKRRRLDPSGYRHF